MSDPASMSPKPEARERPEGISAAQETGSSHETEEREMNETSPRTDTHRPSMLDPAEYDFLAAFYQGPSDAMHNAYREDHREYGAAMDRFGESSIFEGNFRRKSTCDHCGAAFNHGCLFLHRPTETMIHVGHICAANTVGLPSKAVAARKRAERAGAEENERRKRHEAGQAWRDDNADLVEWLTAYGVEVRDAGRRSHPFLDDMVRALHRYGALTERQGAAARKFMEKAAEFAARDAERAERDAAMAPTTPLVEGRRVIVGEILSTKYQESHYGTQFKMLVREDDGNKVWGTCPRNIEDMSVTQHVFNEADNAYDVVEGTELRGQRIRFTAQVERSRDDDHFGFFKRPTGARLVTGEGTAGLPAVPDPVEVVTPKRSEPDENDDPEYRRGYYETQQAQVMGPPGSAAREAAYMAMEAQWAREGFDG